MSGYGKKCCTINNIYPTKEESRGPLKHFSEVGNRVKMLRLASKIILIKNDYVDLECSRGIDQGELHTLAPILQN
ncbi:unnamed protein product [Rhizophagus irregularis]|nr:unnamed protein product [Rhizophagus irregularis]